MFYDTNEKISRNITLIKNDTYTLSKSRSWIFPRRRVEQGEWVTAAAKGSSLALGPSGNGRVWVCGWGGWFSL